MIQFNMKRFKHLAYWTLETDRRWFIKTTLTWTIAFTLIFLLFTCVIQHSNNGAISYVACTGITMFISVIFFVFGGAYMFQNFKTKHDDQRFLMLPASNLEKFLMRYSVWLLLLPCFLLAFVVADIVQWLINTLLAHDGTMLVMQYLANTAFDGNWPSDIPRSLGVGIALIFVWLHSAYVVGATFFRSHKYNWVATSLVLIIGGILLVSLWPNDYFARILDEQTLLHLLYLGDVALVLLIGLNFWLSYKLFCRQQIVGKIVNI